MSALRKYWKLAVFAVCVFAFTFFECYDADPNPPLWFSYLQDRVILTALELLKVVGAIFLLVHLFCNTNDHKNHHQEK